MSKTTRLMAVAMAAGAMAIGSPGEVRAEEFSCTTTAVAPFDTTVDAVAADLPLIQLGQNAVCSSDAVIAMKLRPEMRIAESPDAWSPAGPVVKGTKPGFHRSASMQDWFSCTRGFYRTEARVTAGSYFLSAVDTDDDTSGGRAIDCKVKIKVAGE